MAAAAVVVVVVGVAVQRSTGTVDVANSGILHMSVAEVVTASSAPSASTRGRR
jgi:hypothetical protein